MKNPLHLNNRGFTLVEMMVATAVFSLVMLLCAVGLLQISRTFFKGVTITNTQEVARTVIDELTGALQFNGANVNILVPTSNGGIVSEGYCIGNIRYSYVRGRMLSDDSTQHAFVADSYPCAALGGNPALDLSMQPSNPAWPPTARELLSPRMRVSRLQIDIPPSAGISSRLYRLNFKLTTGLDEVLIDPTLDTARCESFLALSQYCATVDLTTTVQKRVQ